MTASIVYDPTRYPQWGTRYEYLLSPPGGLVSYLFARVRDLEDLLSAARAEAAQATERCMVTPLEVDRIARHLTRCVDAVGRITAQDLAAALAIERGPVDWDEAHREHSEPCRYCAEPGEICSECEGVGWVMRAPTRIVTAAATERANSILERRIREVIYERDTLLQELQRVKREIETLF